MRFTLGTRPAYNYCVPQGGPTPPREPLPEWRTTLERVLAASWRSDVPTRLGNEALAQNVLFEFERPASLVFGYRCITARLTADDGTVSCRVVLSAPNGYDVVLRDAPTQAEALGRALAEHLTRKRRK